MKQRTIQTISAVMLALTSISVPPIIPMQTAYAAETTAPSYQARDEIPALYKWKLEHVYASRSTWEADVKKVEEMAGVIASYQGKLASSPQEMKRVLDQYVTMARLRDKVALYAGAGLDVHTANASLQALSDRASNMNRLVGEKTAWMTPEIVAISDERMQKLLASSDLAPYRLFLEDVRRSKPHILSRDMERLLAQTSPLAGTAESVYSMLAKDIKFPSIKNEAGKEVPLTRSNYVSYLESSNQSVRRAAFQAYYRTLQGFQDTFAQTLAGQVKVHNAYAKARHYDSALAASLAPNNIPVKVYDELIATVHENLPLLHRYVALKKKMLGVQELHMYDMYTPTVPHKERYIPYDEAKQIVLEGLTVLGEDYTTVLAQAFGDGWIDVYSTADKRSGAYQIGAYDTHPYVLLNYQGTADDVSTIAHELGHAMQTYYSNKKQPYITSGYPIFTAEVASTLNEQLLFKSRYAKAQTKEEKMILLNGYLDNFRNTLFRQAQFAEFEKLLHEKEQAGESLNAEAIKKLYVDLNQKYYGAAVVNDPEIAMEWARIPHLYYNFYVYQYATSFAASAALAGQIEKEGAVAVERIRTKFLEAGSSAPPLEILKAAGVDMSTAQPVREAMKQFERALTEMEELAAQK
ncbi:oligoendopeptidase F [Aneurinibacillus soli]|uniref:Oligopeptidase F n=1 Tax=Aneurinibacillus soli TaxID=1500254 RepID=A0A0U5BCK1_9BACL|nr:oligoendopeptidase F [Aneurinibacillus soli]PYE58195.1 oligoendopeptidase F [Aneurinibacillus soli]BAU27911.1 Oligoendopeptidase F, plasmid [Aneurinibacillus soli]